MCYNRQANLIKGDFFMSITDFSIWGILFVCAGVFCASFIDAIAGGGGIISLPVYIISGLPAHMAIGTHNVVK